MTEEGEPEHRHAKTVVMCTIDVHFESIPQKQDCINTGWLLILNSKIASTMFFTLLHDEDSEDMEGVHFVSFSQM